MLNLENLKGIFVAIPIAARPDGEFIEDDYRADIAKLCASGVHGIYTTGTTGEWYAMDDDEFRWMVDVFLEETGRFETLTQIGCGGLCTEAAVRRVKIAVGGRRRPDGLQILLPPWQPLTDVEVVDFFKAVADAAAGVPLVHYNTIRSKRLLGEKEYECILKTVPTLIGTKHVSSDVDQIVPLLRAGLPMNHFVGPEWNAVATTIWGSKGIYSDNALFWPKACLRLFELCEQKMWDEALALQEKFLRYHLDGILPLLDRGYTDAGWDKGKTEAAGFLRCKRYIRPPHRSMAEEDIQHLRTIGRKYFAEWVGASLTPGERAEPSHPADRADAAADA